MRLGFAMFVPILVASTAAGSEVREVRGRVVDEAGRPVEGADVAPYWSANGTGKLADGRTPDLTKADEEFDCGSRSTATTPTPSSANIQLR